jgi:hypothetical protein
MQLAAVAAVDKFAMCSDKRINYLDRLLQY